MATKGPKDLSKLTEELEKYRQQFSGSYPPVDKWNPDYCGDIDICIDRNGEWSHEGTAFERGALVKLFSSILKREGNDHFLVTPVEKMRIQVDVAPFLVTQMARVEVDGNPVLLFTTSTDDKIVVDRDHPIRMQPSPEQGDLIPLVMNRGGMEAIIARPVYYELVEYAFEHPPESGQYAIESGGEIFLLS